MSKAMDYFINAILIGTGATVLMDLLAAARTRLFGTPVPNYGLVGRWIAYLALRQFLHDSIGASPPIHGERAIGWTAHYVIGIAFAILLLAVWGLDWVRHPTIGPALIIGIGSVAAPFLLMQPGMGAGIASSRTPDPTAARLRSLLTHGIFGVGLWAAAWGGQLLDL